MKKDKNKSSIKYYIDQTELNKLQRLRIRFHKNIYELKIYFFINFLFEITLLDLFSNIFSNKNIY